MTAQRAQAAKAAFEILLAASKNWCAAIPALADFAPWSDDLIYTLRNPMPRPALTHLAADPGATTELGKPLQQAILNVAPYAEWRLTYSEEEVGRDFLNRFAWFELAGPTGHFVTHQTRLTIGYWGPNLHYGRHQHASEELYSMVSGSAEFHMDDAPSLILGPEDTRCHPPNQPHALNTHDQAALSFVIWQGMGIGNDPEMTKAGNDRGQK